MSGRQDAEESIYMCDQANEACKAQGMSPRMASLDIRKAFDTFEYLALLAMLRRKLGDDQEALIGAAMCDLAGHGLKVMVGNKLKTMDSRISNES